MSKQIFRQVALERLSSPEQLDMLLQVTDSKSWLSLAAMGLLLVMVIAWSIVGQIPIEVSDPMLLLKVGSVKNITLTHDGQIVHIYVGVGDAVREGERIATITQLDTTETRDISSPYTGKILELKAGVGDLVHPGSSLMSLELVGDDIELEAIMYLSLTNSKSVISGMPVKIAPVTVRPEEYGYLLGTVKSVGEFPSTHEGMLHTLGSEELISALVTEQAPIEVHIALWQDKTTVSGYKWSSSNGPDFTIDSGTLGSASITVAQLRPIDLVLPIK